MNRMFSLLCALSLVAGSARADTFTYSTTDPALMAKVLGAVTGRARADTFTYSTTDPASIAKVLGAVTGTAVTLPVPPVTPPPIVAPGTSESVDGTIVLAPPQQDGVITGYIVDSFGVKYGLRYSAAAKFPYFIAGGISVGGADGLTYIKDAKGVGHVYVSNSVTGKYEWIGGKMVPVTTIPTSRNPNPPVLGVVASVTPSPSSGGTAPPVVATCTPLIPLLTRPNVTLPAGAYCSADVPGGTTIAGDPKAARSAIIIDGTSFVAAGKACLDLQGKGVTLKHLTIQNCKGTSVGCIREDGGGMDFIVDDVECRFSSSGIGPTAPGTSVTIINSYIHDNGLCISSGAMHDIYIGHAPHFALTNTIIGDSVGTGCNSIKSRALVSNITKVTVTMNGQGHIDFPDGGLVTIVGSTFTMPAPGGGLAAGDFDTQMLSYAAESGASCTGTGGGAKVVIKSSLYDSSAIAPKAVQIYLPNPANCPTATLDLSSGDDHWKGSRPIMTGWASINGGGSMTQANAAPLGSGLASRR